MAGILGSGVRAAATSSFEAATHWLVVLSDASAELVGQPTIVLCAACDKASTIMGPRISCEPARCDNCGTNPARERC